MTARIVSLVPSLTELLCALGLREQLVGRTGFCIHPKASLVDVPKVGGTKSVDVERIRALIERVEHDDAVAFRGLDSLTHLKVYIRHPEHLSLIQPRIDALFGPQVARLYLTADICRPELLMEIEAIARAP